jgi:hypothetical protein
MGLTPMIGTTAAPIVLKPGRLTRMPFAARQKVFTQSCGVSAPGRCPTTLQVVGERSDIEGAKSYGTARERS